MRSLATILIRVLLKGNTRVGITGGLVSYQKQIRVVFNGRMALTKYMNKSGLRIDPCLTPSEMDNTAGGGR